MEISFSHFNNSQILDIVSDVKTSVEVIASDTTPLLTNSTSAIQKDNANDENENRVSLQAIFQMFCLHIYIIATAMVGVIGGILFGYHLGIISGALLQMRDHFCLGIVESEVSALVCGYRTREEIWLIG